MSTKLRCSINGLPIIKNGPMRSDILFAVGFSNRQLSKIGPLGHLHYFIWWCIDGIMQETISQLWGRFQESTRRNKKAGFKGRFKTFFFMIMD